MNVKCFDNLQLEQARIHVSVLLYIQFSFNCCICSTVNLSVQFYLRVKLLLP